MNKLNYWLAVISKEHAMRGVKGGLIQVNHGREAPLKRIGPNDWIVIYSPKLSMEGEVKCQAFTAIGQATDDPVYQFQMTDTFIPYRKNIRFYDCRETLIFPLINQLDFIENKKSWGFPFRFGFFEIQEKDFTLIRSKMITDESNG